MSSAIEILKDRIWCIDLLVKETPELNGSIHHRNLLEWRDALQEALLALEKQEKLKECFQAELEASRKLSELAQWLEKEIVFCNEIIDDKKEEDSTKLAFANSKLAYEKVLQMVGEQ